MQSLSSTTAQMVHALFEALQVMAMATPQRKKGNKPPGILQRSILEGTSVEATTSHTPQSAISSVRQVSARESHSVQATLQACNSTWLLTSTW